MKSLINMILYVDAGTYTNPRKKDFAYAAAHGYTYDVSEEGKKTLVKNVPTTTGYYTGGTGGTTTVVKPIDIISITYSHAETELLGTLGIINTAIDDMLSIENPGKIAIISSKPVLERVLKMDCDAVRKNNYQFHRMELSETIVVTIEEIQRKLKDLGDDSVWYNFTFLAEGGLGSKKLGNELATAEIRTQFSGDREIFFDKVPIKEYENPESDLNKIISASRWYFNTGSGTDYYDMKSDYRAYYFGKVEKDKKYYGKVTPDVTYSAFYTKTPIKYLDNLFEFARKYVKNPKELMLAGIMQYMTQKDIVRLNASQPAVPKGKDLIVPFKVGATDDATLIELIDPPALSYLIVETGMHFDMVLDSFLKRDESNCAGKYQRFIDITDKFYVKETNKKGVVKLKLNPDFKQQTSVVKVDGSHRLVKGVVPIMLGVGYDTPDRNSFNSVTDPEVKVWCNLDSSNDAAVIYRTLVETSEWIYLHSTAKGANIRVLNKKELANLK